MRHAALLALLAWGCSGSGSTPRPTDPPGNPQADLRMYDELQAKLDANRMNALDKQALELDGEGNALYWKTYPTFAPTLHRRDDASGAAIDYTFSIGEGDDNNYRASDRLVVTAKRDGDHVTYLAYDAAQANGLVGSTDFPAPSAAKWWAYAVSQSDVYVVTAMPGAATTLYRWSPASGAPPTQLTTLESATRTQIGEFYDFGVDGNIMVFIEAGRVWSLDLTSNQATWLMNQIQVSNGAQFSADGVLFSTDNGKLFFAPSPPAPLRDLSAEIAASSYALNSTFSNAHYFNEDYARWKSWVIYGSQIDGVFAYNLSTRVVAPVLLPPRDPQARTVYRYPVTLTDGALFVTGLMSTDGAVGAEGPDFKVTLGAVLPSGG